MGEKSIPSFEMHQQCSCSGYLKTLYCQAHPASSRCTGTHHHFQRMFCPHTQVAGLRHSDEQDGQSSAASDTSPGVPSTGQPPSICCPRAACAEPAQGAQGAPAPGANPCAGDGQAPRSHPDPHPALPAHSPLPWASQRLQNYLCLRQEESRPARSVQRFRFCLENPLLVIAGDETLGWKDRCRTL